MSYTNNLAKLVLCLIPFSSPFFFLKINQAPFQPFSSHSFLQEMRPYVFFWLWVYILGSFFQEQSSFQWVSKSRHSPDPYLKPRGWETSRFKLNTNVLMLQGGTLKWVPTGSDRFSNLGQSPGQESCGCLYEAQMPPVLAVMWHSNERSGCAQIAYSSVCRDLSGLS